VGGGQQDSKRDEARRCKETGISGQEAPNAPAPGRHRRKTGPARREKEFRPVFPGDRGRLAELRSEDMLDDGGKKQASALAAERPGEGHAVRKGRGV